MKFQNKLLKRCFHNVKAPWQSLDQPKDASSVPAQTSHPLQPKEVGKNNWPNLNKFVSKKYLYVCNEMELSILNKTNSIWIPTGMQSAFTHCCRVQRQPIESTCNFSPIMDLSSPTLTFSSSTPYVSLLTTY